MCDPDTAFAPLIGARQWRMRRVLVELEPTAMAALVKIGIDGSQFRHAAAPIVERSLQRRRDVGNGDRAMKVLAHDGQRAVAAARFESGQFDSGHGFSASTVS